MRKLKAKEHGAKVADGVASWNEIRAVGFLERGVKKFISFISKLQIASCAFWRTAIARTVLHAVISTTILSVRLSVCLSHCVETDQDGCGTEAVLSNKRRFPLRDTMYYIVPGTIPHPVPGTIIIICLQRSFKLFASQYN